MNTGLLLLIVTVTTALIFDFLNGFHDAANSIATVVSTRVLSPKLAVIWAAFFNFVAAFFLGTAVAKTIGKGMIRLEDVTQYVVIAGLAGAIVWDLLTWWWGLPTSSSHALIGGYAGAAMARAALNRGLGTAYSVILPQGWTKTLIFIVIAPVIGLILALAFSVAGYWVLQNRSPRQVDTWFRKLQLLSAAAAKNYGHHCRRPLYGRLHEQSRHGPRMGTLQVVHHPGSPHCHRFGDILRWLAHRPHYGIQNHQTKTFWWILRRKRWGHNSLWHRTGGNSREHHPHHHGRDRWSRRSTQAFGRTLGSGEADRLGVDSDDPCLRRSCGNCLLGHPSVLSRRIRHDLVLVD